MAKIIMNYNDGFLSSPMETERNRGFTALLLYIHCNYAQ